MESRDRSTYHHGDLKAALLREARCVVEGSGHERLSLRACARTLQVDVAAAYRHFPSKLTLLASVAADGFDELGRKMATEMKRCGRRKSAARKYLLSCGQTYIAFAETHPRLYRLMFGGPCSTEQIAHARERLSDARSPDQSPGPYDLLTDALNLLFEAGMGNESRRHGAEFLVWATIHGAVSLRINGRGPEQSIEQLATQVCELLLRGLTRPNTR